MSVLIANVALLARIYLGDFKNGMLLWRYSAMHDRIQIVDSFEDVVFIVTELAALLDGRGKDRDDLVYCKS